MHTQIIRTLIIIFAMLISSSAHASRFSVLSPYSCSDGVKTCQSRGIKKVDGFDVHRDCWQWSYVKTCNYTSKDDCKNYSHCYGLGDRDCLLRDADGACVNILREYSCKRWEPVRIEKETVRTDLQAREGQKKLMCKGVPCIDGNCVDQIYQTNGEMMDSVSKLYAVSKMNVKGDVNFQLFAGSAQHCSKKAGEYTNCCSVGGKGWGQSIGARCTADEKLLMENRRKNLCVYVGKHEKQNVGVKTVVKHHYCCFGSMLDKVIQDKGRAQLTGRPSGNFGSGGSPDCNGLTLAQIEKINFDQLDFSEFIEDFKVKFFGKNKSLNTGDIASRVEGSLASIKKGDSNPNNKSNNLSGWREDYITGEGEKSQVSLQNQREEEFRAAEAARQEELRKESIIQAEQKEKLRILEEEQKEKARLGELKAQRRALKEQELEKLRQEINPDRYSSRWWKTLKNIKMRKEWEQKIRVIEQDLANGNY